MKVATPILLLGVAGCAVHGRVETIAIPGTKIRIEMVRVTEGVRRPFWISKLEVTWGEFNRFCDFPEEQKVDGVTRPSAGKNYLMLSGLPAEFMESDRPVTNLRYHSAMAYCEWLSKKTGAVFRLPTEPEWESACGRTLPAGDSAWLKENSGDQTHPTGGKKPNALGLFDMIGNAWEYCLESLDPPGFEPFLLGGSWDTPSAEVRRKKPPTSWSEADPARPFSTWWFRDGHSQGFRVVRVAGSSKEREAYAAKIEITGLKGREIEVKAGAVTLFFSRVTGEVRNGGDRPLDELGIKVYYLDPQGAPHFEDVGSTQTRRATFNACWPALVNSGLHGDHAEPLKPGERRAFSVDLPLTFDGPDNVQADAFGASVLFLGFGDE